MHRWYVRHQPYKKAAPKLKPWEPLIPSAQPQGLYPALPVNFHENREG